MDVTTVAGSSMLLRNSANQQAMSVALVKMASDAQKQMANMLAQNVANGSQAASGSGYTFSVYA